jgi:hypothetical protein
VRARKGRYESLTVFPSKSAQCDLDTLDNCTGMREPWRYERARYLCGISKQHVYRV